jgi:phage terminase small subunit
MKQNPLFRSYMALDAKFLKLAGAFGLTPLGRARLGIASGGPSTDADDPFA